MEAVRVCSEDRGKVGNAIFRLGWLSGTGQIARRVNEVEGRESGQRELRQAGTWLGSDGMLQQGTQKRNGG